MTAAFADVTRSALLDALYLAPAEDNGWQGFLRALVSWSESRSARLLVMNPKANEVLSGVQVNTDEGAYRAYVDHFVNLCPWRTELGRKPAGRLYSTFLDFSCDQPAFYRSEFFNDWARPLDIHHGACGTVWESEQIKVQLLIQRTQGQGHYDRDAQDRLNQLMPHVRRALLLDRRHRDREQQLDARGQAGRTLPVLLFDAEGVLVFVSPEAELRLTGFSGVTLDAHGPHFALATDNARLQALLRDALASSRQGWQSSGGMMEVCGADGATLRLLVSPVHPDLPENALFPMRAFAALYPMGPEFADPCLPPPVAGLFGLTDAEFRVAGQVASGRNPAQIAEDMAVSIHTVRSHLKVIFRKTGVRRQAQLTSLLLQLAHRVDGR